MSLDYDKLSKLLKERQLNDAVKISVGCVARICDIDQEIVDMLSSCYSNPRIFNRN